MGLNYALLSLAILLLCVTASTPSNTKVGGSPDTNLFLVKQNAVPTSRLLRTYTHDEERSIPAFDKVTSAMKAGITSVKLRSWVRKKKPAADVLVKLKLNEKVDDALASPKVKTLIKYLDLFNNKYHSDVSLLGTLTAHYGDDVVARALVRAKRVESTKEIATKLQTQQLEGWLSSHETAAGVFTILKIRDDGFAFVLSSKLETLEEYIKLFNAKNPQHQTNLFRTLREGFGGDVRFALVVQSAMFTPATHAKAIQYQNALFNRWVKSELDPASVLVKVFNADENNMAAVGSLKKAVVEQYAPFYYRKTEILDMLPRVVHPRRR